MSRTDGSGLRLDERTREECRALAAEGAVVVLPIGATEQHGPHLPIGTDSFHAEHVALAAAARAEAGVPVLVAPTLPYGSSAHHLPFGGTASLTSETFLRVLLELGGTLVSSGFTRLVLLNGHGGNHQLVQIAGRDLALAHRVDVASCSWWHLASPELEAAGALERGRLPGHAGAFETSVILALRPELARQPLPARDDPGPATVFLRDPLVIDRHGQWGAIEGWTDSPAQADAEHGRAYVEIGAEVAARAIRRLVGAGE
jgi:creatinine amidohydrolase